MAILRKGQSQLDIGLLDVVDTAEQERILGTLITTEQNDTVWQGGTVAKNKREGVPITWSDPQDKQTTTHLQALTARLPHMESYDLSESLHTTESLAGLHQHWMSVPQQRIYMSLVFFAIGFSAITALAVAIIGWLSLEVAAYLLIWPSVITWLVVGILYPKYGKLALKGFIIGVFACFLYDCMRFTSIELGLWGDFIPRIGMWLLHTNKPDWLVGYIWRYVGDGGFMSTAFVMGYYLLKPKLDVRIAALAFGIAIWFCLVGTILLAPHGTEMLFPLTPITFSLSLLGHIIYGLSIGFLYPVFVGKSEPIGQVSKVTPSGQSYLYASTGPTRQTVKSQFMRPGSMDTY